MSIAVDLDPTAAYPDLRVAQAELERGDVAAVRARYGAGDWAERSMLVYHLGKLPGMEAPLRAAVAAEPGAGVLAEVLAWHLIYVGWEIRTAARAQYVTKAQFAAFHDHLRAAEELLIDLTARHPDAVVAWQLRLITARGLSLGGAEARRRYAAVQRSAPHHLPAQQELLQQLCPKWGGSFPEMQTFAREAMTAAPSGALNAVLVVNGHLELALEQESRNLTKYFTRAEVQGELREAAARSIWHPAFRRAPGWVQVQNDFAMAFSMAKDWAAAAPCFTAIGNLATKYPWTYLSDDLAEVFNRYRSRALARAGRA